MVHSREGSVTVVYREGSVMVHSREGSVMAVYREGSVMVHSREGSVMLPSGDLVPRENHHTASDRSLLWVLLNCAPIGREPC